MLSACSSDLNLLLYVLIEELQTTSSMGVGVFVLINVTKHDGGGGEVGLKWQF